MPCLAAGFEPRSVVAFARVLCAETGVLELSFVGLLADMADLRVARRAVDVNEIAGVDRPMMDDSGLAKPFERFAQLLAETAQGAVRAAAARADGFDPGGEILCMAFEPELQPARQILLAELLARLPVVEGVAVGREQRDEAGIEAVDPMALVDGLARVLQGVVDQMPDIFDAVGRIVTVPVTSLSMSARSCSCWLLPVLRPRVRRIALAGTMTVCPSGWPEASLTSCMKLSWSS